MNYYELLNADSKVAINFFYDRLKDQVVVGNKVADTEILYVASVLASFSQTSVSETVSMPPLASLSDVFDQFVFWRDFYSEAALELAGAQSLLFAGFFRDQMRRRHNVSWYDELGGSFYQRLAVASRRIHRRQLFRRLGRNFRTWAITCAELHRSCRESRYLLRLD